MFSLHTVTEEVKTVARWIAIGLGGLFLLFIVFHIIGAIKNAVTPPPPPTVKFGKLPPISFPPSQQEENATYTIDTVSGVLPVLPDRLPVYKIVKPTPTLENLATARSHIAAIGFTSSLGQALTETPLSETKYQWIGNTPPDVITMDIDSYDFLLSTSLITSLSPDSPTFVSTSLDPQSGVSLIIQYLSQMQQLPDDIDTKNVQTQLFKSENGGLVPAELSDAQAMRVDLFQKDVAITDPTLVKEKITSAKIYYPNPKAALINGIVVPLNQAAPQVAALTYNHQDISTEYATYPIKTAQEAYNELKAGNAYIAMHDPNTSINIKSVELGYYLSTDKSDYMLPIIVFKGDATAAGDDNFYAYVPAITGQWMSAK